MKHSKIKIKKPQLRLKDFKEMQAYIFDESCICNDNFDKYGQCCGKGRRYEENIVYFPWDRIVIIPRFKDTLENVQEKTLEFYYKEMFLRLTRGYPHYKRFIKFKGKKFNNE